MKKNTAADFENAGYSRADSARLAADPATNWKAANGGKREPLPRPEVEINLAAPNQQARGFILRPSTTKP